MSQDTPSDSDPATVTPTEADPSSKIDTPSEDLPPDSKLTRSKRNWARDGKFLTGAAREGSERLPPGQHTVNNWPVLDLGAQPKIRPQDWQLTVDGLVANPMVLPWVDFLMQATDEFVNDIHCVTSWSRYDNHWRGMPVQTLLAVVQPLRDARAVMLHCADGYTTNLLLEDFASQDALLAYEWQGQPLTREHGGPVRLVVPHLYFWKSAKWLTRIEFLRADQPGFWEQNGYHMRGDPWDEERYSKG